MAEASFIKSTDDLLNSNADTVLCFVGVLVHGGYPVLLGTRWILTVFLYVDANEARKRPGYTIEAIAKLWHSVREHRSMDKSEQKERWVRSNEYSAMYIWNILCIIFA